ncbi:MAG TPA: PIN domain-containing protein [Terriglobales bacterium]|nr:PIN domain-containing protein [Terriglobales bacterium]
MEPAANPAGAPITLMLRVYWDSMLFIYWLEGHPEFGPVMREIFGGMQRRGDRLCTSIVTVGEVLAGLTARQAAIKTYFRGSELDVLPFSFAAAEGFADLRRGYRLPSPDCIHLATAADAGVDVFLTNDKRLTKLNLPGIGIISGLNSGLT